MLARLVSLCLLLSLSIYTCYPVTQINSVNKYAASKVSLLYLMVFFCLSVIHSLANSFANAFFKYNVRRPRQAEIAFPRQRSIFLQRLGFRNDACRRQELLGGDVCAWDTQREREQTLPPRSTYRSRKRTSLLCGRVRCVGTARRKTASGQREGGRWKAPVGWLGYGITIPYPGYGIAVCIYTHTHTWILQFTHD